MDWTKVNWPDWIQAICAILGIFTAYWIVRYEERETERERLTQKLQFAVFTLESVYKSYFALMDTDDSIGAVLKSDYNDEGLYSEVGKHVEYVRRDTAAIEELYNLPQSYWPNVRMYLLFREGHKRWAVMRDEILEHTSTDHMLNFANAREQVDDLGSKIGELAWLYDDYYKGFTKVATILIESTSKKRLPKRYLERVNTKYEGILDLVLNMNKKIAEKTEAAKA